MDSIKLFVEPHNCKTISVAAADQRQKVPAEGGGERRRPDNFERGTVSGGERERHERMASSDQHVH